MASADHAPVRGGPGERTGQGRGWRGPGRRWLNSVPTHPEVSRFPPSPAPVLAPRGVEDKLPQGAGVNFTDWPGACHRSQLCPVLGSPLAEGVGPCSPVSASPCTHCRPAGPAPPGPGSLSPLKLQTSFRARGICGSWVLAGALGPPPAATLLAPSSPRQAGTTRPCGSS